MYKKILTIIIVSLLLLVISVNSVSALEKASGSSAMLVREEQYVEQDHRAKILRKFLESHNSPLADSAETFVAAADRYDLDWRLVASIAGAESTFAKRLPYKSHNAWGWGIYGTNVIYFNSYDEAIETISKALRENYMNKWGATNVYEIGRYYAASPRWPYNVTFFMNRMELFAAQNQVKTLSIAL